MAVLQHGKSYPPSSEFQQLMQPDVTSGQAHPFPMHMCQVYQHLAPSSAPEESTLQVISSQSAARLLTDTGVNSLLSHSKSLWSSAFRDFMMQLPLDRQEDVAAKLHKKIHTSALLTGACFLT